MFVLCLIFSSFWWASGCSCYNCFWNGNWQIKCSKNYSLWVATGGSRRFRISVLMFMYGSNVEQWSCLTGHTWSCYIWSLEYLFEVLLLSYFHLFKYFLNILNLIAEFGSILSGSRSCWKRWKISRLQWVMHFLTISSFC